jgi:hypothetical protein
MNIEKHYLDSVLVAVELRVADLANNDLTGKSTAFCRRQAEDLIEVAKQIRKELLEKQ